MASAFVCYGGLSAWRCLFASSGSYHGGVMIVFIFLSRLCVCGIQCRTQALYLVVVMFVLQMTISSAILD